MNRMRILALTALAVLGLTATVSQAEVVIGVGVPGPYYRPYRFHRRPRVVIAAGAVVAAPPVVVAPAPRVYVAPAPVYVQPAPVYVQPAPVYVQPAPVLRTVPAPVYVAPVR